MASSCSTSLLTPSFPIQFFPYVPPAHKPKPNPKPKSKAISTATAKIAGQNRSGISSSKDDGDWLHIDNFPTPDSNASLPALFGAATSDSEKLENYQPVRESLDGKGTVVDGLFDGSSLEHPLLLESDPAEKQHSTMRVKPSDRASDRRGNGYHAVASTEGYCTGRNDDINAASVHALSVEGMEGIHQELSLVEDEPLFDVDVTSKSSLAHKRIRRSFDDTITSSVEDPHLAKRRRLSKQQEESLTLDYMPTHELAPLPTTTIPDSRSRASNEPSPSPLDNNSQSRGAVNSVPSPNSLDEENGADRTHAQGTVKKLLRSLGQSISPFERIEGNQSANPDLDKRGKNGKGSGDVRESHGDGFNQLDDMSCGASARTSQPVELSDRPVRERRRRPSQTTLRLRQLSKPRTDNATWPCSPRIFSSGTKVRDETNDYETSANTAYQITNLSLCDVPKGSSIITATVHCSKLELAPDLTALNHKLLSGAGKVIQMTQLSPGSWMILGYQCNDTLNPYTHESLTLPNADRISSPYRNVGRHSTQHQDNNRDEEDEDESEEESAEYNPYTISNDEVSGDDARFREQMNKSWSESDKQRLLAYKNKMNMGWKDIFERFPGRTPGAIRTRWHMLRKNNSSLQ